MVDRTPTGERTYRGIPVSAGVSHGKVIVLGDAARTILRREISAEETPGELARLYPEQAR